MSVQAPPKPSVYYDSDEDEEGPAIFKRTNAVPKQNQSNSEVKKQPPQKQDGNSGRQISGGSSNNGVSSVTQNAKVMQSNKPPPVKSPLVSPKASTSSSKPPPVKSALVSPKASTSSSKPPPVKSPLVSPKASISSTKTPTGKSPLVSPKASNSSTKPPPQKSSAPVSKTSASSDWRSKYLSDNGKCSVDKNKSSLVGNPSKSGSRSDESDDDKPLSARVKVNPNQNTKALGKPATSLKVQPPKKNIIKEESSDDEPLSSRFQIKSNAGSSGSKHSDFEDKKPLSLSNKQNGSIKSDDRKSLNNSVKRPLDKQVSDGSSIKKQKISDSLSAGKSMQSKVKAEIKEESDDDVPISQRIKKSPISNTKSPAAKPKVMKTVTSVKTTTKFKKTDKNSKYSKSTKVSPSSGDGQKKWTTLVHNGVIFPPEYSPHGIKMLYNGKKVDLTPAQEEVATMFAVMQDSEYVQRKTFRDNFWSDWRKLLGKNHVIQKLDACDFTPIYDWFQTEKEKKKQMSSEEKKAAKEEKLKQEEKYMWAILDGVKEKVGNFRVEPPGLFRGRGEHPKSGKLKSRIYPKDVTINIGKGAPVPECPIPGQSWKEIRHDNTVTWLAFWLDPISKREFKYVFLAASSSLKGQSDKEKYEKARMLKGYIHNIRAAYTRDFNSRDSTKRQIAVATYLIDKLALRAGNEKDDDEADTVGCCTLKVENVKAIPPNKLEFNFLGKDSIKYENTVEVELPVYKAIIQFQSGGKKGADDLFDDLDTSKLNAHLKELMPGLTAKVFRTYNASITLDEMLNRETRDGTVEEKKTVYNAANKEVAIICNHQRTVSKSHESQMLKLTEKLQELEDLVEDLKVDLDRAKKGKPPLKDADGKQKKNLNPEAIGKKIDQTNAKIEKIKRDMHAKEDIKTIALGTSKLNYLDPRITVAWCKRHEVPIEKIFTKTHMSKFCWAMDVDPDFRF